MQDHLTGCPIHMTEVNANETIRHVQKRWQALGESNPSFQVENLNVCERYQ